MVVCRGLVSILSLTIGCGPEIPSAYPIGSPLSTAAALAPSRAVDGSLREDPPLPGQAAVSSWSGLAPHLNTGAQKEVLTCPMHPEVHSDKPGRCPKCGMNLVTQP
jgi:Heavy metal binding domain